MEIGIFQMEYWAQLKIFWGFGQNKIFCIVQGQKVKKVRPLENNENYEINFKSFTYIFFILG